MSTTLLPLQPGSLASGYCWPSTPQEFANDIFAISSAVFNGTFQTFNFGDTTPAPEDQDKPWYRTINGKPDGWYKYDSGYWLHKHWPPSGDNLRMLWVGTTTELLTYDGGANEAVTDVTLTGPMWEVDTEFSGRSPMGPGTLPLSLTNVAVATNYGADKVTLTTDEMPAHTHVIQKLNQNPNTGEQYGVNGGGYCYQNAAGVTDSTGGGQSHSNLHPVRGCYLIKRTARIYDRI